MMVYADICRIARREILPGETARKRLGDSDVSRRGYLVTASLFPASIRS